ncbi:hypothetical protein EPYR_03132 [Erwinia pyrifoliae DSM 12163]|nr:hypothetical protein EPYR_03132 [Erwinia pyrifoliae DSM 12163]
MVMIRRRSDISIFYYYPVWRVGNCFQQKINITKMIYKSKLKNLFK